MSKIIERQKLIRLYRDETGETEIDMRKVAEFAVRKGWPLPPPSDPVEALAKLFADAARLEELANRAFVYCDPYEVGHDEFQRILHEEGHQTV